MVLNRQYSNVFIYYYTHPVAPVVQLMPHACQVTQQTLHGVFSKTSNSMTLLELAKSSMSYIGVHSVKLVLKTPCIQRLRTSQITLFGPKSNFVIDFDLHTKTTCIKRPLCSRATRGCLRQVSLCLHYNINGRVVN